MIVSAAAPAQPYSSLTTSDISAELQSEPTQRVTVVKHSSIATDSAAKRDDVNLSEEGLILSRADQKKSAKDNTKPHKYGTAPNDTSTSPEQLTAEEQQAVLKLKKRDREVKSHEQAHLATAGQYAAGGPSYSYQTGPDGRRYAIGGEVPIDVGKEKTPEQTIQKMRIVRRAALAPAHPSAADRSIAAAASMKEAEAMRELNTTDAKGQQGATITGPIGSSDISSPKDRPSFPTSRLNFQGIYA